LIIFYRIWNFSTDFWKFRASNLIFPVGSEQRLGGAKRDRKSEQKPLWARIWMSPCVPACQLLFGRLSGNRLASSGKKPK
jgi:hypothetical protein